MLVALLLATGGASLTGLNVERVGATAGGSIDHAVEVAGASREFLPARADT
jgi:hypothetical protein